MADRFEFDHTSIAVRDAEAWLRRLRRDLGVEVLVGEVLPQFRYVLSQVGAPGHGGRLELMDAAPGHGSGFLQRFLDRHGEGVHHLTFVVPDVERTIRDVERLGLTLVNTDLAHPPWRETFIFPDAVHGVVIQLADSSVGYPPVEELLGTRDRDPSWVPNNREGTDPTWWEYIWDVEPGPAATLRSTTLRSTDPELSHRLFADVLRADVHECDGGTAYDWDGRVLEVLPGDVAGIDHLTVVGSPAPTVRLGNATLVREDG